VYQLKKHLNDSDNFKKEVKSKQDMQFGQGIDDEESEYAKNTGDSINKLPKQPPPSLSNSPERQSFYQLFGLPPDLTKKENNEKNTNELQKKVIDDDAEVVGNDADVEDDFGDKNKNDKSHPGFELRLPIKRNWPVYIKKLILQLPEVYYKWLDRIEIEETPHGKFIYITACLKISKRDNTTRMIDNPKNLIHFLKICSPVNYQWFILNATLAKEHPHRPPSIRMEMQKFILFLHRLRFHTKYM
jgi:hypothetical protein